MMKKLLNLMSFFGLTSFGALSVIFCGGSSSKDITGTFEKIIE